MAAVVSAKGAASLGAVQIGDQDGGELFQAVEEVRRAPGEV
jgi:hypothetical protein